MFASQGYYVRYIHEVDLVQSVSADSFEKKMAYSELSR